MKIKEALYNTCQTFLDSRLEVIQHAILDIQNALQSETKSSAGDKHETGRAMLQLEREKAGQQLSEIQKLQETLQKIDLQSKSNKVTLGSVVKTSKANYFVAISAGEIKIDNTLYYAISASTPIAKLILSKEISDTITFRDASFTITEIL
ncbi:3-oxoacyl-ACP synthase [uncultured Winogradskyella sp.]|uniref:3-oxoacyl-ACP synthase n=1 Tax=uncultured Winogradskyella sp. TaxID=395353 RepID=UPI0030D7D2EC|tara:strand:- start:61781 stop:62230 length:450 start_codon:yes stop_codon:yes gene_type:complete